MEKVALSFKCPKCKDFRLLGDSSQGDPAYVFADLKKFYLVAYCVVCGSQVKTELTRSRPIERNLISAYRSYRSELPMVVVEQGHKVPTKSPALPNRKGDKKVVKSKGKVRKKKVTKDTAPVAKPTRRKKSAAVKKSEPAEKVAKKKSSGRKPPTKTHDIDEKLFPIKITGSYKGETFRGVMKAPDKVEVLVGKGKKQTFTSVSLAALAVMGGARKNVNGWRFWKTTDGKYIGDLRNSVPAGTPRKSEDSDNAKPEVFPKAFPHPGGDIPVRNGRYGSALYAVNPKKPDTLIVYHYGGDNNELRQVNVTGGKQRSRKIGTFPDWSAAKSRAEELIAKGNYQLARIAKVKK